MTRADSLANVEQGSPEWKALRCGRVTASKVADIIAKGKELYEGKGTCANCHGQTGEGDGAGGMLLTPGPRNFTNCKFHKKRNDGELFWVLKNGSPGTGMPALVKGGILTEDEAERGTESVQELDELETRNRLAKLFAVERVIERKLKRACRAACRFPGDAVNPSMGARMKPPVSYAPGKRSPPQLA